MIKGKSSHVALISSEEMITYDELYSRISASRLVSDSKLLVFLFCDNSVQNIIDYYSCVIYGHTVALFDKNTEFKQQLIDLYQPNVVIDYDVRQNDNPIKLNENLSLLLSTSGSTGSPKLVRLTYNNVIDNAKNISKALSIDPSQRAITSLPMHYSFGLSVINSYLYSGASVVVTNKNVLDKDFWNLCRDNNCTSLSGVPATYDLLKRMNFDKLNVPSLNVLTQAGGRMNDQNIVHFNDLMKKRNGKLYVMYGQTEATARIAVMPPDDLRLGYAGKVLPGGKITIDDGEIVYEGKNVMMGYAECIDDLSKGDELNGVLRTGDLGFVDDGFIKITGRNKRFAKISGNRINLDEIEKMFGFTCAVVSDNDKLYVFCNSDEFDDKVKQISADTKIFHSLFVKMQIDEFPTNSNKKVDYKMLHGMCNITV